MEVIDIAVAFIWVWLIRDKILAKERLTIFSLRRLTVPVEYLVVIIATTVLDIISVYSSS